MSEAATTGGQALTYRLLPVRPDAIAPDGSLVRLLAQGHMGGMAHFELGPGQVSVPTQHRTVEELWFIVAGWGQMWRERGADAVVIDLRPGVSLSIPVGTRFQFRNTGRTPLAAIGVTMPPWPGSDEAIRVDGVWQPMVNAHESYR